MSPADPLGDLLLNRSVDAPHQRDSLTAARRNRAGRQLEQQVIDDAVYAPIFLDPEFYAVHQRFANVKFRGPERWEGRDLLERPREPAPAEGPRRAVGGGMDLMTSPVPAPSGVGTGFVRLPPTPREKSLPDPVSIRVLSVRRLDESGNEPVLRPLKSNQESKP
jgi:hypothetical protein